MATVALVLVPDGSEPLHPFAAISVFGLGGVVFAITDRLVKTCVGPKGQLLALLADFIPEAMALGTLPAAG